MHEKYAVHMENKESFFNLNLKIKGSNKIEGNLTLPRLKNHSPGLFVGTFKNICGSGSVLAW